MAVAIRSDVPPAPTVEIVVPVYNEAPTLERSVRRLHDFLSTDLPFSWRVVIADNASTDATWRIAQRLAQQLDGVRATAAQDLRGVVRLALQPRLVRFVLIGLATMTRYVALRSWVFRPPADRRAIRLVHTRCAS